VGVGVVAGTLLLNGSSGNQTNHTQNQMFVGYTTNSGAALILTNTILNVDSWLALGRINGGINNTSSITLYNSALTCGNLSLGWDGGLPNNLSSQFLTLNGSSTLTDYGAVNLAEGANASFTLNIGGTSTLSVQNPFYACLASNARGALVVANSGKLVQTSGWFDVGQGNNSVASMLVENNGSVSLDGDFNLTDTATNAVANLALQDNAQVSANTFWVLQFRRQYHDVGRHHDRGHGLYDRPVRHLRGDHGRQRGTDGSRHDLPFPWQPGGRWDREFERRIHHCRRLCEQWLGFQPKLFLTDGQSQRL
jgi:hypothetical protein